MTWWATILGLIFDVVLFLLAALLLQRQNRQLYGNHDAEAEPARPVLTEVYAMAMGHWNERFYAALEAALPPGVCNCGTRRITNACPIHARSPERTYSLQGIHRHIESNRKREEKR